MNTLDVFCCIPAWKCKFVLVVSLGSTRQLWTSESPAAASGMEDASCLQQSVMRDIVARVSATTQCCSGHEHAIVRLVLKKCASALTRFYGTPVCTAVHHRESVPMGDIEESRRDVLCTTIMRKRCHVSGCAGCSPRARALPRQA